jgi:hypothetical protein
MAAGEAGGRGSAAVSEATVDSQPALKLSVPRERRADSAAAEEGWRGADEIGGAWCCCCW